MKKSIIISAVLLLAGIPSLFAQQEGDLQGAWKLTYQKFTTPDTTIEITEFPMAQVKIFTKKYFSLSTLDENNQFNGHYGTYTCDGNVYTENIEYSSIPDFMGHSYEFDTSLEGDLWTIKGEFVFNGQEIKLVEKWAKMISGCPEMMKKPKKK